MYIYTLSFIVLFSFAFLHLYGQKQVSLAIRFPKELHKESLQVSYENGKEWVEIKNKVNNDVIDISDSLYTRYALVQMSFTYGKASTPYFKSFFFNRKRAKIDFMANDITKNAPIKYKLYNCIESDSLGMGKMKMFTSEKDIAFNEFYAAHAATINENDSLMKIAERMVDEQQNRQIEFVKQNGRLYYSLWFFRTQIANSRKISKDTLLHIFRSSFTASQRQSLDGKKILSIINRPAIISGVPLPHFSEKGINGRMLSSDSIKSRYFIVDFWASWCTPCVQELPKINELRNKYPKDKLEVIFITQDTDSTKFAQAVKKYHIGWGNHFYATSNLIKIFDAQAIPKVFLVDPAGVVLYNNTEQGDLELLKLEELLSRIMK